MDRAQQLRTLASATACRITTKEGAAIFLSAAETPEDWNLRIKYIAAWNGNAEEISNELWEHLRKDTWVVTTAIQLGVTKQPIPVGLEDLEIFPLEIPA